MPFIKGKDIKLFYEDVGIGKPIIFLHGGFSRGILSFASQMFFFQATAEFRCILPDLRGYGRTISQCPEWTTPQLADDIINLMDDLKISRAHIIGHSLGGDVALYCATKYTDRCISITSISSTGSVNEEVVKHNKAFEPEALEQAGKTNFIEMIKKNHYDSSNGNWKRFLKQVLLNCEKYPDFSEEDLQKVTIPSLFITGEKDELIKEIEILRLKQNIKDSRFEMIEGCGHSPHFLMEKPMEVNELIYNFLKQIEA